MASLSLDQIKPLAQISLKTTSPQLRKYLEHVFTQLAMTDGVWLVGGTALAGFYAEHRRSDDLDLFVNGSTSFKATVKAVQSLKKQAVHFLQESHSAQYYRASLASFTSVSERRAAGSGLASFTSVSERRAAGSGLASFTSVSERRGLQADDYRFTIDIVLDENLHRIGHGEKTKSGVWVADLKTILITKIATLVSRCSEKDLFDLNWLLNHAPELEPEDLIALGAQIDGGLNTETLLLSLQSAVLSVSACGFVIPPTKVNIKRAHQIIVGLKNRLIKLLLAHVSKQPLSETGLAIKKILLSSPRKR